MNVSWLPMDRLESDMKFRPSFMSVWFPPFSQLWVVLITYFSFKTCTENSTASLTS